VNDPLLKVDSLNIDYGRAKATRLAVRDLSFEIKPGTTLGVIGESGAGKSSMALALVGLLDDVKTTISGKAFFRGQDLLSLSEADICRIRGKEIGMIFQDPTASLNPAVRVLNQVTESVRLHQKVDKGEAQRQALHKLMEVGVSSDVLESAPYAHQLSGGQCQRIMIATALANEPSLLIADEPTSSLDVTLQAQIMELIRNKQLEGELAMIFVSHDLALVSSIADELLVLYQGQVVEYGNAQQVLQRPAHEYTAELIAASMSLEQGGTEIVHT